MSFSISDLREEFNAVSREGLSVYCDTLLHRIIWSNCTQDEKDAQFEILKTLLVERAATEAEKFSQFEAEKRQKIGECIDKMIHGTAMLAASSVFQQKN